MRKYISQYQSYIVAVIASIVIATVYCIVVPNEYIAQTKVSDEAKETDLGLGLNQISVMKRDLNVDAFNSGLNNAEIYSKVLKSYAFCEELSDISLGRKNYYQYCLEERKESVSERALKTFDMLVGDYQEKDYVTNIIADNLKYNYSTKYKTLTIEFCDKDPHVAALMVDSITNRLQHKIDTYRRDVQQAKMDNEHKALLKAQKEYKQAMRKYSDYVDSHGDITIAEESSKKDFLQKETQRTYQDYSKHIEQYTRAKCLSVKTVSSFAVIKNTTILEEPTSPSFFPAFITVCFLLIVGVCAVKLYRKRILSDEKIDFGDIFSPWTIMIAHWGVILLLFNVEERLMDPLNEQFYISLALWVPIFCISAFITYNILPSKGNPQLAGQMPKDINSIVFNTLYCISMVITPLYVMEILKVVTQFDTTDLLYNIRLLSIAEGRHGFLGYSHVINQVLLVVALWRMPQIPKWQLATIFIAACLSAFAIMEKGMLLYALLIVLFVLYQKKYIKTRTIGLSFILIFVLFFFINLAREEQSETAAQDATILDFFGIYVLSGPVAFGRLTQDLSTQFGVNTFSTIYLFLERIFPGQYEVREMLQEFVYVPLPTNVYTIMQPFYVDFGYKGVAFFALFYGIMTAVFYRMFRNGSTFGACMYAYFAEILIIQFHQEEIFLALVHFIQYIFFMWICTQNIISFSLKKNSIIY